MKLTRRLLSAANIGFRIIALIASFAVLTSPLLARDDGLNGCTPAQEQSASGVACGKKMDEDMSKHYTNIHTLRCTSGRMECCIQLGTGGWGQCEPALAAPRNTKDIQSPSTSDVVCASLKSARGEWKADSRSIKANSDNKTCSQTYVCGAPTSASCPPISASVARSFRSRTSRSHKAALVFLAASQGPAAHAWRSRRMNPARSRSLSSGINPRHGVIGT